MFVFQTWLDITTTNCLGLALKSSTLISIRDHYQKFSLSQISDAPPAGFEPEQNLNSDFVKWSCVVVISPHHNSANKTQAFTGEISSLETYKFTIQGYLSDGHV